MKNNDSNVNKPQVYLASTSPRRQSLLQQIGVSFECLFFQLNEDALANESPQDYADRLALAKATTGWQSLERKYDLPVLGADTIVVLNNKVLGKPKNKEDGIHMLQMLSGKTHEVCTSIAIVQDTRIATACSVSRVQFRDLTLEEIHTYWDTNEPQDKAGSYAVQGKGAVFIKHIEGSYSGIMGLPLYETALLLKQFN